MLGAGSVAMRAARTSRRLTSSQSACSAVGVSNSSYGVMPSTLGATPGYLQHYRWVVCGAMAAPDAGPGAPLLIAGSIATDHLMTFDGKFSDSLVVDQLDKLSVSFLVHDLEVRRGGCAGNISFGLGVLGVRPVLVG